MTYVRRRLGRRRRARGAGSWLRARLIGLLFLAFAVVVTSAVTYLIGLIPSNYIYVSGSTISVGSSLPQGASGGLDVKVIVGILGWGVGIFLFISAIRRLGVTI